MTWSELYQRLESSCAVKPMTLPRSIRDKTGRRSTSPPAELDAAESRSDLLYRLKKKYGATVEEMLAYLDTVPQ
ncbi:MAG: hypothetical protein ACLT1A_03615 [Dysosmobacter sp.]